MTTASWSDLDDLIRGFDGHPAWRDGHTRAWRVLSPTGGTFSVEVTLRPRWCSIAIDRWHTTDRQMDTAQPWLEANVWPLVEEACRARGSSGTLPSGRTFTSAHPVAREELPGLLSRWVTEELGWGISRDQMGHNWGPRADA